jgi:non-homologous end joining protein Ku
MRSRRCVRYARDRKISKQIGRSQFDVARARPDAAAVGQGLARHDAALPHGVRADEDYFDEIPETKVPKDMLALAEHILDSKKTLKLYRIMPRDG